MLRLCPRTPARLCLAVAPRPSRRPAAVFARARIARSAVPWRCTGALPRPPAARTLPAAPPAPHWRPPNATPAPGGVHCANGSRPFRASVVRSHACPPPRTPPAHWHQSVRACWPAMHGALTVCVPHAVCGSALPVVGTPQKCWAESPFLWARPAAPRRWLRRRAARAARARARAGRRAPCAPPPSAHSLPLSPASLHTLTTLRPTRPAALECRPALRLARPRPRCRSPPCTRAPCRLLRPAR
jgi:hypothetical protein